jgi:hypothetical protein
MSEIDNNAQAESMRRVDELAADGDAAGVAIWRPIIDAIGHYEHDTCSRPLTGMIEVVFETINRP